MTRDRDTFDMFKPHSRGRFGDEEQPQERVVKSSLIDLYLLLHAETHPGKSEQGAILVSETGDESKAKWIPKSLCQFEKQEKTVTAAGGCSLPHVKVTTEEWIAKNKGFL